MKGHNRIDKVHHTHHYVLTLPFQFLHQVLLLSFAKDTSFTENVN